MIQLLEEQKRLKGTEGINDTQPVMHVKCMCTKGAWAALFSWKDGVGLQPFSSHPILPMGGRQKERDERRL